MSLLKKLRALLFPGKGNFPIKSQFGLVLRKKKNDESFDLEHAFDVIVSHKSGKRQGDIFIPAQQVDELVAKRVLSVGTIVGEVGLILRQNKAVLLWNTFNPFSNFSELTNYERILGKKGTAATINAAVIARLKKECPGVAVAHAALLTPRQDMLDKMGINYIGLGKREELPIEEYYVRNRDYLRRKNAEFSRRRKRK